ncbi:MAG: hypothetical protein K0R90_356 [Oscillospiraceae bacterium]|jgi:uncharacterized beta-barrel protein YwiB (DUF1934 family)|nr:hypothetical protein [Oscillospiraceae bacterium]
MKTKVLINIKSIQTVEEDQDVTEFFTNGNLYFKNDKWYITYEESETTGYKDCTTTLKIDGDHLVTMLRNGSSKSHLVMERGRRNIGYYGTPHGELVIGVFAKEITSHFDENGGNLYCRYHLDINSSVLSKNEIYVDVKPC